MWWLDVAEEARVLDISVACSASGYFCHDFSWSIVQILKFKSSVSCITVGCISDAARFTLRE